MPVTNDPGISAAALVAFLVALMYTEGGIFRPLATIIIIAVLITPPKGGQESVLSGLLKFLNEVISAGNHPLDG
jgi:hypothetical protein